MKVFISALLLLGIGVLGMAFNIIFRKKSFPQTEVGSNENMKKMGIKCIKEEEEEEAGKKHINTRSYESCSNCGETKCW
jgi:hypothetical protein